MKFFIFSGAWDQNTTFWHLAPKIRFGSYLDEKLSFDSGWGLVGSVILKHFRRKKYFFWTFLFLEGLRPNYQIWAFGPKICFGSYQNESLFDSDWESLLEAYRSATLHEKIFFWKYVLPHILINKKTLNGPTLLESKNDGIEKYFNL